MVAQTRTRHNSHISTGPEYPLDMLRVAGKLLIRTPDGRPAEAPCLAPDRADAGARLAALHWRLYGYAR
jgi:hypothetical protein